LIEPLSGLAALREGTERRASALRSFIWRIKGIEQNQKAGQKYPGFFS